VEVQRAVAFEDPAEQSRAERRRVERERSKREGESVRRDISGGRLI
jgi:hypothetical protein